SRIGLIFVGLVLLIVGGLWGANTYIWAPQLRQQEQQRQQQNQQATAAALLQTSFQQGCTGVWAKPLLGQKATGPLWVVGDPRRRNRIFDDRSPLPVGTSGYAAGPQEARTLICISETPQILEECK